jgi:hypothetical protein
MGTAVIHRILLFGPMDFSFYAFDISAMACDALLELRVLFTAASIFDIPLNTHNVMTRRNVRRVSIVSTAIQNLLFWGDAVGGRDIKRDWRTD